MSDSNIVRRGAEFDRIAALPRRAVAAPSFDEELAEILTKLYARPNGTVKLRPIQARALLEANQQQGALWPIGVGAGKTLAGLLLPNVLNAKVFVYFTTPRLVEPVRSEIKRLSQDWVLSDEIYVVSYSTLSTVKGQDLLERLQPDAIYADEAHNLRHLTSTRTKRLGRYLEAHESVRFVAASGTFTSKSIRDYAHLSAWALREGSPLPTKPGTVDEWARALDAQLGPKELPNKPGALLDFCLEGETPRVGFRRRLVETKGVVATTESALGTGLEIRALRPPLKAAQDLVKKCLKEHAWDEAVLDPLAEARVVSQLALGFFYRWEWPNGERDEEWLLARNGWARAVRGYLERNDAPGKDSPLLVAQAADRGECSPWVQRALAKWRAVKDRPEPPVVAIWSEQAWGELCGMIREWLWEAPEQERRKSIIWYYHRAIGTALAEAFPLILSRPEENEDPSEFVGTSLLLSIKKHGTGLNLQPWNRNLVLTPPSNGATWEQMTGRTHRPGQLSDTVSVDVLQHVAPYRGALAQARADALYIEHTMGQQQKLNLATYVDFEE